LEKDNSEFGTMSKIIQGIRLLFVQLLLLPVYFYQYAISPLKPATCRHFPTCSQYAVEALKVHGPFKGLYLAIHRFLRCNPWGTHGYDPVPPKKMKVKLDKTNKD
jgi:putative membrane protein insertion efficiency factor